MPINQNLYEKIVALAKEADVAGEKELNPCKTEDTDAAVILYLLANSMCAQNTSDLVAHSYSYAQKLLTNPISFPKGSA